MGDEAIAMAAFTLVVAKAAFALVVAMACVCHGGDGLLNRKILFQKITFFPSTM